MRFLSSRAHGVLDYIMGAFLILMPWIFGFSQGGAETLVPVILGASMIIYSLLTEYELGLFPTISLKTHLLLDGMGGALLAISPWLFGFSGIVTAPFVILGVAEILASLTTETVPSYRY